jgi:hypothetical protein
MGEWSYSPNIFDTRTRWRWFVSFTLLPLYSQGNSQQYPLDRRLDGPQSRSGHYGEDKNLVPARNRTPAVQPVACLYLGSSKRECSSHFINPQYVWERIQITKFRIVFFPSLLVQLIFFNKKPRTSCSSFNVMSYINANKHVLQV